MSKRSFRTPPARVDRPSYPTLERFNQSRREALRRLGALGAAVLGAGGLLAACTRPNVLVPKDGGPPREVDGMLMQGAKQMEDARLDERRLHLDQRVQRPDQRVPDASVLEGDVAGPDARIEEPDLGPTAGVAPLPPAPGDAGR